MDAEQPSRLLTLKVRGVELTVPIWESGEGAPLLMLHGWGLDHTSLDGIRQQLGAQYRCVSIDFPGFGRSPAPPQPWGISDYAELICSLLDALGFSDVALLGHSFGGRVALRLSAFSPSRINQLVLIASAGLRPNISALKALRIALLRVCGRLVTQLLPSVLAGQLRQALIRKVASRDYLAAGELRPTLVKVVNEDAALYAQQIEIPALLLWGELDADTPVWMGRALEKLLKSSRLLVLPGFDHLSILSHGRFQLAFQISQFLQRSDQRQPSLSSVST
jgi:pimeloyl-ACP methyl ester carboxylesterase